MRAAVVRKMFGSDRSNRVSGTVWYDEAFRSDVFPAIKGTDMTVRTKNVAARPSKRVDTKRQRRETPIPEIDGGSPVSNLGKSLLKAMSNPRTRAALDSAFLKKPND